MLDLSVAVRPPALFPVIVAGILCLVMAQVPGFNIVLYPLRLLTTMIHEGGHAVATLLSGGQVVAVTIEPDGSGLTTSLGGWRPLILSAGYLGTTLVGCLLLLASRIPTRATLLLFLLGTATLALTVFFGRNWLAWAMGLFWGLVLAGWALRGPRETHGVLLAFLGIQDSLNGFSDMRVLFDLSVSTGTRTDAAMMSREIFWGVLPPAFWAVLWAAVGAVVTVVTLRELVRTPPR